MRRLRLALCLALHFLRFLDRFLNGTNHVERLLGQFVIVTIQDALKAADGFLEGNVLTGGTGEYFSNVERLGQKTLDLTGTGNGQLVFL
jgi:hypothetical protein